MDTNELRKNKIILVVIATIVVLVTIVPSFIPNKKEDKKNFPTYTNVENTNNLDSLKKQLEQDYNFRKEMLINDYDYDVYTSIDIQNMLWNFIFSYEINNTKYLSSKSDTKYCMRESYVIDGFKELYNVDISKDLHLLPGYYKYVTFNNRKYCFNYKNVSLEYNNSIRVGINNLTKKDDVYYADIYLYEYYILNSDAEISNEKTLERYIESSNYNEAKNLVNNYLAGRVTHKNVNFKIDNRAKFFKYKVLYAKNIDN